MQKKDRDSIKLPKLDMTEVSDYYTLYVDIFGVPENVFWFSDIKFVKTTAANKQAFDSWMKRQREKLEKEKRRGQ